MVGAIGSNAFDGCARLTAITISNTVTAIESFAFYNCTSTQSIIIAEGVTSIGNSAFYNCAITEITIPDSVTSIGNSAFYNCAITEIVVPDNVTNIGYSAFKGCNSLEKMVLPFVGADINADRGNYISYVGHPYYSALGYLFGSYIGDWDEINSTVPQSLRQVILTKDTTIGQYAFYNCDFIEIISLPNGVTSIGNSAFQNCTSLKKLTINMDGTIGSNAFSGCTGLVNITISGTVSTIGEYAFADCNSIDIIAIPQGITSIGYNAFYNCSELTNLYFGGTKSEWNNIQFGDNWDTNANSYYLHYNAFEYGIYIPTGTVKLINVDKEYVLFPLGATVQIQVLDIKTGELISINDTDIKVEITSGTSKLSFASGYLVGNNGGQGTILANYVSDGKTIKLEDTMPIFVVESSNFELDNSLIRFSAADREYISMCLDMYHSLYIKNDIEGLVDINMNVMEDLLYDISNLDDYLAGLIEGDLPKTTVLKKTLSEFIDDYIDKNYAHLRAVEDTKVFLAGFKAIHEINGDYEKLTKFPNKIVKLIEKIDELYIIALLEEGLTKDQVATLSDSLNQLVGDNEAMAEIMQTNAWKYGLSAYNQDYKNYVSAIERVNSNISLLDQLMDSETRIKLIEDSLPDDFEVGMMVVDTLIYALTDYSHNIELLQTIRTQMLSSGYAPSDVEVHVIDELIKEYEDKYWESVSNFIAEIAADTIIGIASKNPVFSIVTVASDIAMMLTPIDEKAEWLALSCYRDALKECISPIKDVCLYGTIPSDKNELELFVSLYLNMLLKSNNLAYRVALYSPEDQAKQLESLENSISKINNMLKLYCS